MFYKAWFPFSLCLLLASSAATHVLTEKFLECTNFRNTLSSLQSKNIREVLKNILYFIIHDLFKYPDRFLIFQDKNKSIILQTSKDSYSITEQEACMHQVLALSVFKYRFALVKNSPFEQLSPLLPFSICLKLSDFFLSSCFELQCRISLLISTRWQVALISSKILSSFLS